MGTFPQGQIRGDQPPRGRLTTRLQRLDCRHLDAVEAIASACFETVWKRQDFAYFLAHDYGYCVGIFADGPDGGELVAYFLGLLVQGDMDVVSVATAPAFRRQGIALRLMKAAAELPHVTRVFLEVAVDNAPAITLYEKLGFSITGVRRGYYEHKRDALLMARTIAPQFGG